MDNTRRIQCRCGNVSMLIECCDGQDTVNDVLVTVSGMYLVRSVQDKDSQQSNLIQLIHKSHCLVCQCDICVIQGTGTTTDQAEGGVILSSQAVDFTLKSRFIRLLDGQQINIVAQDASPLQQPDKDLDQWASILNSLQQLDSSLDSASVDQQPLSLHLQRVVQMAMKDYQTRLKLERDEQMRQSNDKYESRLLAAQQVFTRIKADLQSVLPKQTDPGKTNSMAPSFNQSQIPQDSAQSQIQGRSLEQTKIDNDDDDDDNGGVFELDMEGRQQQQGVGGGSLKAAQTYRKEDDSIDEQDEDLQQNEQHSGADQVMANTSILSQSMPINIKTHMQSSIMSHLQKEQQEQKQQQQVKTSQNQGEFVAPHVLSMQTFKHSDPFAEYKPTSSSVIRNRSNHNRFT
ncbi:hypothetical protein MIR68_004177 [Amoeboaphelidium protococcarum]|nr:hypothetical protein MIR68_004177 [Amoeboaphelidium protococcarum]